jgi:hypothetical protein
VQIAISNLDRGEWNGTAFTVLTALTVPFHRSSSGFRGGTRGGPASRVDLHTGLSAYGSGVLGHWRLIGAGLGDSGLFISRCLASYSSMVKLLPTWFTGLGSIGDPCIVTIRLRSCLNRHFRLGLTSFGRRLIGVRSCLRCGFSLLDCDASTTSGSLSSLPST